MNFYNDIDPNACAWTRELIRMGLIPDGEVHETDLWDIVPEKLMGFTQAHFCNGIGVWAYALRQASWPDDRPCWTASLPCQTFSAAGKGVGLTDERHLWPGFFWLVQQCRPVVVFGEQVEAAIKYDWLDHVALSLEGIGYTVGAVSTPACAYGAPHIRQRVYWVANSQRHGCYRERIPSLQWKSLSVPAGGDYISPWNGIPMPNDAQNKIELLLLDDGAPSELEQIRLIGNAIVAPQAIEFIRAAMEIQK